MSKNLDVKNAFALEKEINKIWIGNIKLHVNTPRFKRYERNSNKGKHTQMKTRIGGDETNDVESENLRTDLCLGSKQRNEYKQATLKDYIVMNTWI